MLVITLAVATTRVLLGVHWLTDVIAGAIFGWTWFVLVTVLFGGRILRFGEPAERIAEQKVTPAAEDRQEVETPRDRDTFDRRRRAIDSADDDDALLQDSDADGGPGAGRASPGGRCHRCTSPSSRSSP